jgi:hypothetical protein
MNDIAISRLPQRPAMGDGAAVSFGVQEGEEK